MEVLLVAGYFLLAVVLIVYVGRFHLAVTMFALTVLLAAALVAQATFAPRVGGWLALALVFAVLLAGIAFRLGVPFASGDDCEIDL